MAKKIKSQEFGVGDLLCEGWRIYRSNFKEILIVILCVYIPINIIFAFFPADSILQESGRNGLGLKIYNYIVNLLEFIIGIIAIMGIAKITENAIEGQSLVWSDAIKYALSKWGNAIGTGLLSGLILFGLTLLFFIPGIIYSLYYTFWIFAVTLRDRSGKEALDYSKNLVKGQWWNVFGIQLVLGLIAMVAQLVIYPINLISKNPIFGILPNTLSDIIGSFFTITSVLFFLNNDYTYRHPPEVKIQPMEIL